MQTFKSLGLTGETLKGILDAGYESPTPIQVKAIPVALQGKDLIGCAQTGTGKTAAFVLPTIQQLAAGKRSRNPRSLVVAPTRELALQVETALKKYGKFTGLKSLAVFGGVSIHKQQQVLRRGVDVVVATPGRLLDLMNRRSIDLSEVQILILDEADRMFDMGFINDIKEIVRATPKKRQTLLFSATMPKAVQALTRSIQYKPVFIEVGNRTNPADSVTQRVCRVDQSAKMELLCHILSTEDTDNVIVFSRTKHRADKITRQLDRMGFAATAMHSNKTQHQRQRALEGFRRGKFDVLVATDIAARGIDVDGISHVINYDAPGNPEDYIHRIGRTGRANEVGSGITFVTRDDERGLLEIEQHTGAEIEVLEYDGFNHTMRPERPRPTRSSRPKSSRGKRPSNGSNRKSGGYKSRRNARRK
ncbi:MAG: DEAD/DEAH box helicase [Rhodothermales bacterium]|nr:DEAD/DEAH box helicase [Rhodothermales bacterium]